MRHNVQLASILTLTAVLAAPAGAQWTSQSLSATRNNVAAVTVGNTSLFAGGLDVMTPSAVVDVYDSATTSWSITALSAPRLLLAATSVGNTVLFGGGLQSGNVPSDVVDIFNAGTGHGPSIAALSAPRAGLCATSVAGVALFAAGSQGFGSPSAVVDFYEPVGISYCLAKANSSGCAATIGAGGSKSLAANDLVLSASCMPDGAYLFFHASTQMLTPFGDSYLCAGGDVVRILPSAQLTSPGVRNFQCWFRDPAAGGAGYSTSDALAITFVP